MDTNLIALKQLDAQLQDLHKANKLTRPKQGWVRTLRKTLGMTIKQLAKRLQVDPSRIVRIEIDELKGATTLRTLEATAEALDCTLVYAFVPRSSLEETIKHQANKVATEQVSRIAHTMELEAQSVSDDITQAQIKALYEELLTKSWKHLWDQ